MGCSVSGVNKVMSLFGRNTQEARAKLERKLYIAKESPEPDFDLSDCQLRHLPSGVFSLCKVFRKENLYLQSNHLQTLAGGGNLSDLHLLKVVNLNSNKFSFLPNDIKYLINLTELYIHDNLLENIPDYIKYLQNLKILDASRNCLKSLTPSLGDLKCLRTLKITDNKYLTRLCPELCLATNIILIELDSEQYTFPPYEITSKNTTEIMKYLCSEMNVEYSTPLSTEMNESIVRDPITILNPFLKQRTTWEEHEAAIIEQENRIHKANQQQREKFLSEVLQEQLVLDTEIAKVHEGKEIERQKLIKAIQEDEKEITCLVNNFIQYDRLQPEVIQQQLAYEQAEHDRLLEITRQNYDNVRRADILKAMEQLIEEDYSFQYSKKHYKDYLNNMKQSMMTQETEVALKLEDLLNAKDESRTVLVQQLLEDQDVQKAMVSSLLERVDARSWSLNQEISLISSHLARLSVIEQEKKKMQIFYNYNELLEQRIQLVILLDDLFNQRNKRRKQLLDTLKEAENETDQNADFWLKSYQKLLDAAPKTLLNVGKVLDPLLANYLLQEGVIHCLPFLVKFLFSGESLTNITYENLKENGVSLKSDRENIIKSINLYVSTMSQDAEPVDNIATYSRPSAPILVDEQKISGVVSMGEAEILSSEGECVVCMDTKSEVVFVPCGHMCCCQPCAYKDLKCCPMCRTNIERTIKVLVA